jgi:FtsP/CotA-like multicopper oxidase with cupredoxin domain
LAQIKIAKPDFWALVSGTAKCYKENMERRKFLSVTASGVTMAAAGVYWGGPWGVPQAMAGAPYALTTGVGTANLTGNTPTKNCWLYNGSCPGPMLRYRKGDRLSVNVTNNLATATTVHWHGIRSSNAMDGVADLTQPPIQPGEQFSYDLPLPHSGTYWYHAHNMGWEQVARGLYGPLIIDDDDDPAVDHDITLMIDDWRLDQDGQIDTASFGSLHDWSHGGRLGNWLTVNGLSDPKFFVKAGARLRLRLISAANARVFAIKINADAATLIAQDGAVCRPEKVDVISLAPAQRADIIIDLDGDSLALTDVSTGTPYPAGSFIVEPSLGRSSLKKSAIVLAKPQKIPDLKTARTIPVHMQGGAMGTLAEARLDGEILPLRTLAQDHKKLWAFNGVVGTYSETLAEVPLGQLVALEVFNDTAWPHAMHLHGHHFWVTLDDPTATAPSGQRDTWLMPAGSKAKLVFRADNPGLWLFHCHMLEHAASGMSMVIAVG